MSTIAISLIPNSCVFRKWELVTTRKLLTRERRSILANHHCEQPSLIVDEDDVDVIKEQNKVNQLEAKMNETGMNPILMVKDLAKVLHFFYKEIFFQPTLRLMMKRS